jgi:hypothetical protein
MAAAFWPLKASAPSADIAIQAAVALRLGYHIP